MTDEKHAESKPEENRKLTCGVVMPISGMEGLLESHWTGVLKIIKEAVEPKGFDVNLVSTNEQTSVIINKIIDNLYHNDIVICDVSCKNANVMFELGIRLAFDRPLVIIKDKDTKFTFDIQPIEHIEYPRLTHYFDIVDFKNKLAAKVEATYKASLDPKYKTVLQHYGRYEPKKLETTDVTVVEFLTKKLNALEDKMDRIPTWGYGMPAYNLTGGVVSGLPSFNLSGTVARYDDPAGFDETLKMLLHKKAVKYRINDKGTMRYDVMMATKEILNELSERYQLSSSDKTVLEKKIFSELQLANNNHNNEIANIDPHIVK